MIVLRHRSLSAARGLWTAVVLLGSSLLAVPATAAAQVRPAKAPPPPPPGQRQTVVVVAGPRYKAGAIHRLLLGSHYRRTWTTPVEVQVLDLRTFAGGLTPKKKGGGLQTRSLSFDGRDGIEYRFRSVDKDPTPALPEDLRDTVADWIFQDQISASHPAAPLVVDALAEAAGIWHVNHRMFVMPDDPLLAQFRGEFAGMLGMMEEKPDEKSPTFRGARKIVDSEDLIERLDAGPGDRVDAAAFLKARLFDVFVGDWDRHWDQWDWLQKEGESPWRPIPKDRDNAFSKFDGLVLSAARKTQPRFVNFERRYPSMVGINWNAQFIDRRLLSELDWPAWQEIAHELQSRLTDAVIRNAVRRMPPEYYRVSGGPMEVRLRARRDRLVEAARDFYDLLAEQVAVQATDQPEIATIVRRSDGQLDVTLAVSTDDAEPYFRRRFHPGQTREVRIFLAGGDDRAVVRGDGPPSIKLRVIGGKGNDVLDDSQGGGTEFFDHEGENRVVRGPGTSDSDKPYETPRDAAGNPLRDWGHQTLPMPVVSAGGDLGLLLGARVERTSFGFRKHPYAARQSVSATYSLALQGARIDYEGEWQRTNSRKRVNVFARASDIEVVRFHGFGNQTTAAREDEFYKNEQRQLVFAPSLTLPLGGLRFTVGPLARYSTTRPAPGTFLDQNAFYGEGEFGEAGGRARLSLDRRNNPWAPSRGVLVWTEAAYYPAVWSVREPFGSVSAEATTYLRAGVPLQPTLALRAGGKKLWGEFPFHEAAFIGGPDQVRGLRRQRYAGDAATFGNAELRVTLARPTIVVPTDVGLFALADAGRVFVSGEPSDRWHTGVGGGVWLSFYRPLNTISLAVARSEGVVRVYFQGGLSF